MAYRTIKPVVLDSLVNIAVDYTGNPFSVEGYDRFSLLIRCVGTMVGTLTVEGSVNYYPNPPQYLNPSVTPADWVTIPLLLNAVAGVDQGYMIDFTESGMPWLRVKYVADLIAPGVGTLTSVITAKEY